MDDNDDAVDSSECPRRNRIEPDGNKKPTPELTGNQLKALSEILASGTMEEASSRAGISKSTLYEWLKQKAFRKRLEEAREAVFNEALAVLKGATEKAARKLIALLDSKDETTQRLTAREILSLALKAKEMQDLETRIGNIEEILKAREELHSYQMEKGKASSPFQIVPKRSALSDI